MKRVRTFKFKKNGYVDLDGTPEYMCNVIKCGDDKYTLRDFKLIEGHDDSLPYSATLCINGKPICKCFNDGCGGDTQLTPINIQSEVIMKSAKVMLSKFGWISKGIKFQLDLTFIADTLAITENAELKRI